ncbi:hypothetical protein GCM10017776_04000 [Streptomyces griseoluteus]|nr:hypothetical protein GCM10017776_04000 [Streptomyces griseoluteus]
MAAHSVWESARSVGWPPSVGRDDAAARPALGTLPMLGEHLSVGIRSRKGCNLFRRSRFLLSGDHGPRLREGLRDMAEQDDWQREFDIGWADSAEHKEPSARARMLAARWKENPPAPLPFRADPTPVRGSRRSSWVSTVVVLGCVAAVIVLLGWAQMRSPY